MTNPSERDELLRAVLLDLATEATLMRRGDAASLASVDHGARLIELRSVLDSRRGVGTGTWPDYVIESAELVVRRAARQGGALLALEVVGTENESGRSRPWTARIAVRRAENGRWLIVEVSERRSN